MGLNPKAAPLLSSSRHVPAGRAGYWSGTVQQRTEHRRRVSPRPASRRDAHLALPVDFPGSRSGGLLESEAGRRESACAVKGQQRAVRQLARAQQPALAGQQRHQRAVEWPVGVFDEANHDLLIYRCRALTGAVTTADTGSFQPIQRPGVPSPRISQITSATASSAVQSRSHSCW